MMGGNRRGISSEHILIHADGIHALAASIPGLRGETKYEGSRVFPDFLSPITPRNRPVAGIVTEK